MNWQFWFSLAIIICWLPLSSVLIYLFIKHRHHEAIKCRFPLLTLYPSIFNHICAFMLLSKNLILSISSTTYFPCPIIAFFSSGIIPLILIETNRTKLLIMKYNPEKRIGSKLVPLLKTRNQFTLLCFFSTLNVILFAITLGSSPLSHSIETRRECYYMLEWHIYLVLIFFIGTFPLMLRTRSDLTLILDRWNAAAEANRSTAIMTAFAAGPYIILTSYFYFSDSQWRRYEFEDNSLSFELCFVLAPMICSISQLAEPLSQIYLNKSRRFDPNEFQRSLSANPQPSTAHSEFDSQSQGGGKRKLSVIIHDPDLLPLFDSHLRKSFALELLMFILESKNLFDKGQHLKSLLNAYESGTGATGPPSAGNAASNNSPQRPREGSVVSPKPPNFLSPQESVAAADEAAIPANQPSLIKSGSASNPNQSKSADSLPPSSDSKESLAVPAAAAPLVLAKTPSGESTFHFDFLNRASSLQETCAQCDKAAVHIYKTYIQSNSSLEINISGTLRFKFDETIISLNSLRKSAAIYQGNHNFLNNLTHHSNNNSINQNNNSAASQQQAAADPLLTSQSSHSIPSQSQSPSSIYWHAVLEFLNLIGVAYEEVSHLIEINLMKSFLETDEFQQYYFANEKQNSTKLAFALGLEMADFIDPTIPANSNQNQNSNNPNNQPQAIKQRRVSMSQSPRMKPQIPPVEFPILPPLP